MLKVSEIFKVFVHHGSGKGQFNGEGLTQVDLALGMDGQPLAIVTPDSWSSAERDFVHYGCKIVEVESLDPPSSGILAEAFSSVPK